MTIKERALVPYRKAETSALALVTRLEIVPVPTPPPEVASGFLRLASHILLRTREAGLRVIGVVSALPSEGKSTSALNLAICLGRSRGAQGRVLLVDGDTYGRTLTTHLGKAESGNGQARTAPSLLMTPYRGVDLLTAPVHDDALAVHDPSAWRDLLEALRARYSLILIDCPSVLGSAEGLVLPSLVDAHLYVVRSGVTPRESVEQALKLTKQAPLGVILNCAGTGFRDAPSSSGEREGL